jgi:hypothetical protein
VEMKGRKVRDLRERVEVERLLKVLVNVGDHAVHAAFVFGAAVGGLHWRLQYPI